MEREREAVQGKGGHGRAAGPVGDGGEGVVGKVDGGQLGAEAKGGGDRSGEASAGNTTGR